MAGKALAAKRTMADGDYSALLLDRAGNLKVTNRPTDVGALGAYGVTTSTGTIAATMAAAKDLWGFRNGSANQVIVRRITVSVNTVGAPTAGVGVLGLFIARGFTASYSANGVAATLTGNNAKKKTAFATTGITQIYTLDTNVNGVTGATRTLDAQTHGRIVFPVPATASFNVVAERCIFDANRDGWPIVLAQDEGLVIQNLAAWVGATSTWNLTVTVEWEEVPAGTL